MLSSSVSCAGSDSTFGAKALASPPSSTWRVYSPSATEDFNRCPIYAHLKKRWQPRTIEWEPALTLGKAVQVGINVYLTEGERDGVEDVVNEHVRSTIAADFTEGGKYTLDGLTKLALRGVNAVLDANLFTDHDILMVDETLGASQPDVVSRHRLTKELWVHDFKVSQSVRDDYRAKRLEEYDTKHQFWHYAWEGERAFGEPVAYVRPILVILTPKAQALWLDIRVEPKRLAFWLRGAEELWSRMERSKDVRLEDLTPNWDNCYGKYGKCPFLDACHVFHLDMQKASIYYEEVSG